MHAILFEAGIGGVTTVAVLVRAGLEMTRPEVHAYYGGCASTYCHLNTYTDLQRTGYSHNQHDTHSHG